ncbi:hypothetical protein PLESTB_000728200 [Pleodorina starrii]|uniref:Uncharacterized protein n=1 Tax=Pleodorina starrii TaxID=330485 RepID=A0A9W6BJI1_9CHLO|nr:hypothetical protein PLESTM_000195800 [Pleodorina starrii]GLC53284.1 hypothetical protein PLESTB_000728200 [Pleodorina starrii]
MVGSLAEGCATDKYGIARHCVCDNKRNACSMRAFGMPVFPLSFSYAFVRELTGCMDCTLVWSSDPLPVVVRASLQKCSPCRWVEVGRSAAANSTEEKTAEAAKDEERTR